MATTIDLTPSPPHSLPRARQACCSICGPSSWATSLMVSFLKAHAQVGVGYLEAARVCCAPSTELTRLKPTVVYLSIWNKPVATAPWDAAQEGADAADWAQDFANHWGSPLPILAGGVYAAPFDQPAWPNLPHLVNEAYNASVKAATKVYCGHLYALSNSTELSSEMNHARTAADLSKFVEYVRLTKAEGRDYILGTSAGFLRCRWRVADS